MKRVNISRAFLATRTEQEAEECGSKTPESELRGGVEAGNVSDYYTITALDVTTPDDSKLNSFARGRHVYSGQSIVETNTQ